MSSMYAITNAIRFEFMNEIKWMVQSQAALTHLVVLMFAIGLRRAKFQFQSVKK